MDNKPEDSRNEEIEQLRAENERLLGLLNEWLDIAFTMKEHQRIEKMSGGLQIRTIAAVDGGVPDDELQSLP